MLAIRLMRMGAKKSPSYRVVVKEKLSKRDGAYVENVGFYNPTREPAEVRLKMDRVNYWIARGAQPTDTVRQLIRQQSRAQAAEAQPAEAQPAS
ncbi:MAG TPA: 30S ribosomal protein S16 [Pyrinomonadaceae bacterium]|nr:30S ribosomal protein S16 [Pyrinomonadaceae bacterium]